MPPTLLSLSGINKRYRIPVLKRIDIDFLAGEVHALIGANGAGKTTLCNVICGLTRAQSGTMTLAGESYAPRSIKDANAAEVQLVRQELNLVGNLSVAENMFLSDLPHRLGFVNFTQMSETSHEALAEIGLADVDPRRKVAALGVGQQQLVEIARTLLRPCRLLILDEPTAALTQPQVEILFERIEQLKKRGTTIIYISHRMEEFDRIADRITILKDGVLVSTSEPADVTDEEIVRRMAGSVTPVDSRQTPRRRGPVALRIEGVSRGGVLTNIDLAVYRGEILGIAGLIGSGRTELLRTIFGAEKPDSGSVRFGADLDQTPVGSPVDAVRHGIGLVPEDRRQQGLLFGQSIRANIALASLDQLSGSFGFIDRDRETRITRQFVSSLALGSGDPEQPVDELSGGNQQKVTIARWLLRDCAILLLDEPTRGVDLATRRVIYRLMRELAGAGKALVIVSSETKELTDLCDRIVVMSRGWIAAEFARGDWTEQKLMSAAFSDQSSLGKFTGGANVPK